MLVANPPTEIKLRLPESSGPICLSEIEVDFLDAIPEPDCSLVKKILQEFSTFVKGLATITSRDVLSVFSQSPYFRISEESSSKRCVISVSVITCYSYRTFLNLISYEDDKHIFFQFLWDDVKYSQYTCGPDEIRSVLDFEGFHLSKSGRKLDVVCKLRVLLPLIGYQSPDDSGDFPISISKRKTEGIVVEFPCFEHTTCHNEESKLVILDSPPSSSSLLDILRDSVNCLFGRNSKHDYTIRYGRHVSLEEALKDTHLPSSHLPSQSHLPVRCIRYFSEINSFEIDIAPYNISLCLSICVLESNYLYSFKFSRCSLQVVSREDPVKVITNIFDSFSLLEAYEGKSPCPIKSLCNLDVDYISIEQRREIRKQIYFKGELALDTLADENKRCFVDIQEIIATTITKKRVGSAGSCGLRARRLPGCGDTCILVNKLTRDIISSLKLPDLENENILSAYMSTKNYSGNLVFREGDVTTKYAYDKENRLTSVETLTKLSDSSVTFTKTKNNTLFLEGSLSWHPTIKYDTREYIQEYIVLVSALDDSMMTMTIEKGEKEVLYVADFSSETVTEHINLLTPEDKSSLGWTDKFLLQRYILHKKKDRKGKKDKKNLFPSPLLPSTCVSFQFPKFYTCGNEQSSVVVTTKGSDNTVKSVDQHCVDKSGHLTVIRSVNDKNLFATLSLNKETTKGSRLGYKIAKYDDGSNNGKMCLVTLLLPTDAKVVFDAKYDKYRTDRALVLSIQRIWHNGKKHEVEKVVDKQCSICKTQDVTHMAEPCKHTACIECWMEISKKSPAKCHICRTLITGIEELVKNTGEMEMAEIKEAYSCIYANNFTYKLGSYVNINNFDSNQSNSCGAGLHYQTSIDDAMKWMEYAVDYPRGEEMLDVIPWKDELRKAGSFTITTRSSKITQEEEMIPEIDFETHLKKELATKKVDEEPEELAPKKAIKTEPEERDKKETKLSVEELAPKKAIKIEVEERDKKETKLSVEGHIKKALKIGGKDVKVRVPEGLLDPPPSLMSTTDFAAMFPTVPEDEDFEKKFPMLNINSTDKAKKEMEWDS